MIFRDIIESRSYEYAAPDTPLVTRCDETDGAVTDIRFDDEGNVTIVSDGNGQALTVADIIEIDPDVLSDILECELFVELSDGSVFSAADVFGDVGADGELFVFLC